jgi:2-polyprenyl-3-methyl-5-hydroxy-6-metoxy-1,4-benzoquinol methylase
MTSTRTDWTEERIRRLLDEEELDYQRIALPFGLSTTGNDRSGILDRVLPPDLSGKTVLDVGASLGYFCFEALRRGAARAVGVDVDPETVRKATLIADCLGLNAEFQVLDVDSDPIGERFDYVLCLNVIHHTRNPITVLDRLIRATKERLVLEVASLGRHDRRKLGISSLTGALIGKAPAILVGRQGAASAGEQRFFLTGSALENFLRYQRRTFGDVRIAPSGFKDRFLCIADKRRIDELVVVAGPTSVGKSTLIDRLLTGRAAGAAATLGVDEGRAWVLTGPTGLHRLEGTRFDGLLYHYDFVRPVFRSTKTHHRDETLEILDTAARLTFATLVAPPEILRERLLESEIRPKTVAGRYRGSARYLKILKAYEDPPRLRRLYDRWLSYCATREGRQVLVSTADDQPACHPIENWETVAKECGLPAAGNHSRSDLGG